MLDPHDPKTARLMGALEEQIEKHRDSLERLGKDAEEYAVHRGQIKALRWVVALFTPEEEDELDV